MVKGSGRSERPPIDLRLEQAIDRLGGGVAVTDQSATLTYVNPWLADRLGFALERILGRPVTEFLSNGSETRFNIEFDKGKRGTHDPYQLTWRQANGGSLPTIVFDSPIHDAGGNFIGSFAVIADITEPRRIEEGLAIAKLASQVNSTVLYRARYGRDIAVEYVSRSISQFGYTPEDFTGGRTKLADVVHGDDVQAVMAGLSRHIEDGTDSFVQRYRVLTKNRETRWVEDHVFVLREPHQQAPLLHGFLTDITENQISELNLRNALIQTIQAISVTVDKRDPYTAGHQRRVALLSRAIGSELRLESRRLEGLYLGALIHDIGKVGVPIEILAKPGRLTESEMGVVRAHVDIGADIVREVTFPWAIIRMIEEHHERLDGQGYPKGLLGKDILVEARILAVADVLEAMSGHRPYRPARGLDAALAELARHKETLYDRAPVDACMAVLHRHGTEPEALWRALGEGEPASLLLAPTTPVVDFARD